MKFALTVIVFLTLPLIASEKHSILVSSSQEMKDAMELAYVASGIVKVPCRLVNSLGRYILFCGKTSTKAELQKDLQHLRILGFEDIKILSTRPDTEIVIDEFQPISMAVDVQRFLIKLVQKKLPFTLKLTTAKQPSYIPQLLKGELNKQGKYFIDRGWAAFRKNNFTMAESLFELASKVDTTRLDAKHGLALTYFKQNNFQAALPLLESLVSIHKDKTSILLLLVNANYQLRKPDKMQFYLSQLSTQSQQIWRKKIANIQFRKQFYLWKKTAKTSALITLADQNKRLADQCRPADIWLKIVDQLTKKGIQGPRRRILKRLWSSCDDEVLRFGLIHKLKPLLSIKALTYLIHSEKTKTTNKAYKRKLNKLHFELSMEEADKMISGSKEQGEKYKAVLKSWNNSTRAKMAFAWWQYNNKFYLESEKIFNQVWKKTKRPEALKGWLYSLIGLHQNDKALKHAQDNNANTIVLQILKKKLSESLVPSAEASKWSLLILDKERQHLASISALGWYAFKQKKWSLAQQYFQQLLEINPDNKAASEGLLLVLSQQNNFKQALVIATKMDGKKGHRWRASILKVLGQALFKKKEYSKALNYFEQLNRWKITDPDILQLYAWSLFHTDNYLKAGKLFYQLYLINPDISNVDGYLSSLDKLSNETKMIDFIDKLSTSDNAEIRKVAAARYFSQGLLLKSAFLGANKNDAWLGIDSPYVWLQFNRYQRDGISGISQFDRDETSFGLSWHFPDVSKLSISWHIEMIDAGYRSANPIIGRNFLAIPVSSQTTDDTIVWPWIEYQSHGKNFWRLGIGSSPNNGPVANKITWDAFYQLDNWEFNFSNLAVDESALSYLGWEDPYSGDAWGGVQEMALSVGYQWALSESSINTTVRYSTYDGENILDNNAIHLNGSWSLTEKTNFSTISYGLFAQLDRYSENHSFFTFGYGGYFSPQQLFLLGPFLSLESHDQKDWWYINIAASAFQWHSDPAETYPLDNIGQFLSKDSNSGFGYSINAEKHWLISQQFEIGIGIKWNDSPGYREKQLGLSFRFFFASHNRPLLRKYTLRNRFNR